MRRALGRLSLLALSSACFCCAGQVAPLRASAPVAPVESARCKIAASQDTPLVTEWPASEKANLEVLLRSGGVAVAYSGCEMRILPACRVGGAYQFQRTTPATDGLEIRNADELYAKLPLGAASLEGELKASGRLSMQTTVSGQLRLGGADLQQVHAVGACDGATHVVSGLTVGAFKLKSGGELTAGANVGVSLISTHGSTSSSEVIVREAGDPARCSEGTGDTPNPACGSPIQMFLQALPDALQRRAPAGMVKVNFISGDPEKAWEVVVNDQTLCSTPCSRFLNPSNAILLREKDPSFFRGQAKRELSSLDEYAEQAPLDVVPHSRNDARKVTGITFVSLSGMATAAGITLTAVGCATKSHGMCTAGLITAPIGLAALGGSLWLLLSTPPGYDVRPAQGLLTPAWGAAYSGEL